MRILLLSLVLGGCEFDDDGSPMGTTFDPPSEPPHDDLEDGYRHAEGKDRPFLCKDNQGREVTCPINGIRPAARELSCDAAGCHGDNAFNNNDPRHLEGSDGPSCFTCHDREWNNALAAGQ